MSHRIGFGYDVHKLMDNEPLFLGGIKIYHTKGVVAHSDGDVLIHAICDALLGAANLGDIGHHFPDTDASYKGISSIILLKKVMELLRAKGYEVCNIDSTVVVQRPKISPYVREIQEKLAQVIEISEENISVKATTTEYLGFEGREEGISAHAVAMIYKKD
jgi:2-C-methyl-D-erythritol 2,4-cyclodiphosphate synthase